MGSIQRIHVGDVPLPELEWNEMYAGLPGVIRIGGHYADIEAAGEPTVTDDGLILHDVDILTCREYIVPGNQWEIVQEVVYAAYESIGPECFAPCKEM